MVSSSAREQFNGLLLVLVSYACTLSVSMYAGEWWLKNNKGAGYFEFSTVELDASFVADLAGTVCIFIGSLSFNNSSLYDAYWSAAPIFIACYWLGDRGFDDLANSPGFYRKCMVFMVMFVWGNRLTWNWARSWTGFHHEDWRYVEVFQKGTKNYFRYWAESFGGIHLFPTVIVFAAMLPSYWVLHDPSRSQTSGLTWWDACGAIVGFGGSFLQFTADNELKAFREAGASSGARNVLDTGVWAWSRHPNYFGEIMHWASYVFFCAGAFNVQFAARWCGGAVAIASLFVFASVPMMEDRMAQRRGKAWDEYVKRTPSRLLPIPR